MAESLEYHKWRREHSDFCQRLIENCDIIADLDPSKQNILGDQIHEEAKRIALNLNKVTKKYEKQQDLQVYWEPDEVCDGNHQLLNKTIMEYLIRNGKFNVVNALVKELKLGTNEEILKLQHHFSELNQILLDFQAKNLDSALKWASKIQKNLLTFKLHKLKYLQILKGEIEYPLNLNATKSQATMALSYARDHLSGFFEEHGSEIKRLATCVIYSDLKNTPYAEFDDPQLWQQTEKQFTSEFCLHVGLAPTSPLFVR
eukprot:NODE_22_length_42145_cov_1.310612.p21 type:complete len:258 gc:universal NODE_22_length_42145_cov_1.310612:4597-3824(-)